MKKTVAKHILNTLATHYGPTGSFLHASTPWELLVATMLSAQCTDERVNRVTHTLFRKYTCIQNYAQAIPAEFEKDIHSTGFFRNKTKHIIASAQRVLSVFGGIVPETMADLLTLPGVARKTANIVLVQAFGKTEGIAIDTHVKRLSSRLGFTTKQQPDHIEKDLMTLFQKKDWHKINYYLICHGRAVCPARKPKCPECLLHMHCPSVHIFYPAPAF